MERAESEMWEIPTRQCQELVSHGDGTLVLGLVQGVLPPLAEKLGELGVGRRLHVDATVSVAAVVV